MRVFITGATGYIGQFVVKALCRAGHEVTALARSRERTLPLQRYPVDWIFGDLRNPDRYSAPAAKCDGLIHLGADSSTDKSAVDRLALETLIAAARESSAPRALLYTSGIWVLGSTGDRAADETAETDHPAELVTWRPGHERLALEAGGGFLVTAIARPGVVFGGRGGLTEDWFAKVAAGSAPTLIGDGRNRWPTVHGEDVADLYLRIMESGLGPALRERPPGERIFHAIGAGGERVGEMAQALIAAGGFQAQPQLVPLAEARREMGPLADALALDQTVVAPHTERVLGWRARFRGFAPNAVELLEAWRHTT
ncbi:MAG TPA: NAD-dependent epimerase/dehydratase family protein [Acidobacteriota bacterium]